VPVESDIPRRAALEAGGPLGIVGDWAMAMSAAERVRVVAHWSLEELAESEVREREHRALGRSRRAAARAAASELAALAASEKDDHMIQLNAMALISMVSATDALIEAFVPTAVRAVVDDLARLMIIGAENLAPNEQALRTAEQEIEKFQLQNQPHASAAAPRGAGANRWENVLARIGMRAPPDRPVPKDLDLALNELIELRHVLVHRAGRIDSRALSNAKSLRYDSGELVQISSENYRRYSAALWTYGEEIIHRLLPNHAKAPTLQHWHENYRSEI